MRDRLEADGYPAGANTVCTTAAITGTIKQGDAAALKDIIDRNTPFIGRLILNSAGGSVQEALKLGQLARKHFLMTEAPLQLGDSLGFFDGLTFRQIPGAKCVSACFFVWLGGTYRGGNFVGYHRPYPLDEEMQRLSPSAAADVYRDLSLTVRAYLADVEAAPHWLNDMLRVGSSDMHMLNGDELQELHGDVPSMAQWKSARCGNLSAQEQRDLHEMTSLAFEGKLPRNLMRYQDNLDETSVGINRCEAQALILARWQSRDR